jgi:dTDP-glucose pyrophosphorylase
MDYVKKLINVYECLNADAAFIVLEIDNPKQYGTAEAMRLKAESCELNQ